MIDMTAVRAILLARRNHGGMHCLPRIRILSLENKKNEKYPFFFS
jgi:hypothetical protein